MTPEQKQQLRHLEDAARSHQVGAEAHRLIFPPASGYEPLDSFLPSPISIPPKKSGKISIAHRLIEESTPVIGMRQAFLRGISPVKLKLDEPLLIHELGDGNAGVWMTDLPEELHQIAAMVRQVRPRGRVLVGGLGLGLIPHYLARLPAVEEIVVVERSAHVIKLVESSLPAGVRIIIVPGTIEKYLRAHDAPFDYYLLDTWQATSESAWWGEVMPLKRTIRNRWGVDPVIHCWAEDIMAGQVLEKLASNRRNWHYEKLPPSMSASDAAYFFKNVGAPIWETQYGKLVPKPRRR